MQGLRPLFLLRLRLAPKQASAMWSRRRNSLRSSGLHHSKKNLEYRLTQKEKSEEWGIKSEKCRVKIYFLSQSRRDDTCERLRSLRGLRSYEERAEAITAWLDYLRGSARKYLRRCENRLAS